MRRLEEIPVSLVPAFYQHVYDRILYGRGDGDTPARALTAMGMYNVIARILASQGEATIPALAAAVGMTYPGVLKTLRYLERLGLVSVSKNGTPANAGAITQVTIASPFVENARRAMRKIERVRRDLGDDQCVFDPEISALDNDAPALWAAAYSVILSGRGPDDTAVKALKTIGLLNVMARMAACNIVVTKTMLAARLDMVCNALTPQIEYLVGLRLVEKQRHRLRDNNGMECRIILPKPFVTHVQRSLRRLEAELEQAGWEYGLRYRRLAREHRKHVMRQRGAINIPESGLGRRLGPLA